MPEITIDGKKINADDKVTVLEAARQAGIRIPALCRMDGKPPEAGCMVCVVKVKGCKGLVPSCVTRVEQGMEIESDTSEIKKARTQALELLFSEHRGSCYAPCVMANPVKFDIPFFLRLLSKGQIAEAGKMLRSQGSSLSGITDPSNEKACRRGLVDEPVAINILLEHVLDLEGISVPESRDVSRKPVSTLGTLSVMGRMSEKELDIQMQGVEQGPRISKVNPSDISEGEVIAEAARCMQCTCSAVDDCRLKELADQMKINPSRFRGEKRPFEQDTTHPNVVYESGKCINCQNCVRIASEYKEKLGLAAAGRGFNVTVTVPFGREIDQGLKVAARECVQACPTGALVLKLKKE